MKIINKSRLLLMFAAVMGVVLLCNIGGGTGSDAKPVIDPLFIGNITQLNPVHVAQVITPTTTDEIVDSIRSTTGAISIGGGRYSQGGQVVFPESLHIDMRQFNRVMAFDKEKKQITVQAGIRWRDIQDYIDPYNLSLKIMQTYANFTVGGSLSVNAHGRYVGEGALVKSVESIKLVLANGEIKEASRSLNPELFYAAIGGYGGIGVIVEAQLQLVDNHKVTRQNQVMPVSEYKQFFFEHIRSDKAAVFSNADIYPPKYENLRSITWYRSHDSLTEELRLIPRDTNYYWSAKVIDWIADYEAGIWLRENVIDPVIYSANPVVWRNYEASYDVKELEPGSRAITTYGLREYFVPVERFDEFVAKMRETFNEHNPTIINVSVRHAYQDAETMLAWAKTEVFAFVIYYRQETTESAQQEVKEWTRKMNATAIDLGGAYYLPYQVHETREQFLAAYPRAPEFFAIKRSIDPDNRFRNQLWSVIGAE